MKAVTFALLAWVFLGLELGLKAALGFGQTSVAPSFVFVLLTFIAMSATPRQTAWSAIVLGLLMDVTNQFYLKGRLQPAVVIGPNVVAYLVASQLVLTLRGVMIRRNPFTLGFLAFVGSLVAGVVFVGIFALRTLIDDRVWQTSHELWVAFKSSLYTGVAAIPLALVLMPLGPLLGLPGAQTRRFSRPGA